MKRIFNKIIRKAKAGFTYPYYYYLYVKGTAKELVIKDGKYAIVNIDKRFKLDDFSRYFYMVCLYLDNAGFNVIVNTGYYDFKNPMPLMKMILQQPYIFVRSCATPLNTVVLVQPNTADHVIRLSYGYGFSHVFNTIAQSGEFDCILPFPMHPIQYKYYSAPASLPELIESNRAIKIFFAGNVQKDYKPETIKKFYNLTSRPEIINFILSRFEKNCIVLKNESDRSVLTNMLESDSSTNAIVISEVRTEETEWLKILSEIDFFICAPGQRMPWAHNCIEAMSAGTIPILEYAGFFHPHLKHLKNCLAFSNYEELQTAIETALAMDAAEIKSMRQRVLQYHHDYLSMESITKKIQKFSTADQQELKVAVTFIPTTEERRITNPEYF